MAKVLTAEELMKVATLLRTDVLRMLEASGGSGHVGGPLGMAELIAVLYFKVMRIQARQPDWEGRDYFVLSNGHTAPIVYAALARRGFFETDDLLTLRSYQSRLQGHPERTRLPGIEATSGPLGSGLSQAAGMAYDLQYLQGRRHQFVYTMLGDGELNEGPVWEAAMFASKYKLSQLIAIVDRNNIQLSGTTEQIMPLEDLKAKWESFGWHVQEINGHDVVEIEQAMQRAKAVSNRPCVIIARTIPGKGVDFMEYDARWHGGIPHPVQEHVRRALQQVADGNKEAHV